MIYFPVLPEFSNMPKRADLHSYIVNRAQADAKTGFLPNRHQRRAYVKAVESQLPNRLDAETWNQIKGSPQALNLFAECFLDQVRDQFLDVPLFEHLARIRGDDVTLAGIVEGLPDDEIKRRVFIGCASHYALTPLEDDLRDVSFDTVNDLICEIEINLHGLVTPARWPVYFRDNPDAKQEATAFAFDTARVEFLGMESTTRVETDYPILWAMLQAEEAEEATAPEMAAAA